MRHKEKIQLKTRIVSVSTAYLQSRNTTMVLGKAKIVVRLFTSQQSNFKGNLVRKEIKFPLAEW